MSVLTLPNAGDLALSVRAKAMVFEDPLSRALLNRVRQIAPSDVTALIVGETGTGKEIVARHVHELSARRGRPFVAVNCAALAETLVDSELFGHERGAFTGAVGSKPGWFECADGGTLFLDEVGDLPAPTQVKLLRVLQEREVVRVGARAPVPIDVRLIAATNVDLEKAVAAGKFREDLYYRIKVVVLALPPLRERQGDVLPLARHFVDMFRQRLGAGVVTLDPGAEEALLAHAWPGNIRELENVIHQALLVCREGHVTAEDLHLTPRAPRWADSRSAPAGAADPGASDPWPALEASVRAVLEEGGDELHERIDRLILRTAFELCDRNQVQSAKLLGISRNVLRARLIGAGELRTARPKMAAAIPGAIPAPLAQRDVSPPGSPRLLGVASGSRPPAVRIGYQQFGLLWVLRATGALDRVLAQLGAELSWIEYASGAALIEALRANDVDLGVVGEAPPLLGQAARAEFVYLAAEPPSPEAEAIVVPRGSAVTRVVDLRGGRIALTRGTNAHFLLLRALEEAVLEPSAVEVVFVEPGEARCLFESGAVDAWAIWDPVLAAVQQSTGARVLRDATGLASNRAFYIGARALVEGRPELVDRFLAEIARLGRTAAANPEAVIDLLGDTVDIPRPALLRAFCRNRFGVRPFDGELVRSQQDVADLLYRARLIPHPISIAEARWNRPSPFTATVEAPLNGAALGAPLAPAALSPARL